MTADFFSMFGARLELGRLLLPTDFGPDQAVVLSHTTWRNVFGADSSVVGRSLRIDGAPGVVVGVLDAEFVAPDALEGRADIWRPADLTQGVFADDNYYLFSVALQLRETGGLAQAQAEANAVAQQRAREAPDRFLDESGNAAPITLVPLQEATSADSRKGLLLMLAAVTVLLLVACVNVALLFIARGVSRVREISVRRALGAGAALIARQLAVESVMVGLAGAAIGAAIAVGALRAFRLLAPATLPRMDALAVDTRVLAFAVVVGTLTALLFGLLPAMRMAFASRGNPLQMATRGTSGTRGAHRAHQALVVAEIGLSLFLTAQAAWLVQGFSDLHAVDLGFRTEDVWTAPLTLAEIDDPVEFNQRTEAIRASLESVPGVRSATYGLTAPLEFTGGSPCCWQAAPGFPGADERQRTTVMHPVDAGYLELLEMELVAGQGWTRTEVASGAMPAVLSEALALDVFGSPAAALNRAMTLGARTFTIVGVSADNRHYGPNQAPGFAVYLPLGSIGFAPGRITMVVRTEGAPAGLPRALSEAVWRVEPNLAVPTVRSMEEWAAIATGPQRFLSTLFSVFGAVAVLLMAGGLAGTLFYNVNVRRRELGTRLALGATTARVQSSVIRRGLLLTLSGAALGGAGAWIARPVMEAIAPGMQTRGAAPFLMSVAVLLGVALLSSWLPARSAGRADAIEALRGE